MPTGYTSDIYDGKDVSFPEFMLKTARAFGATILLRDESGSVLPTVENVVEPLDYTRKRLEDAVAEVERLHKMTLEEATTAAQAEYALRTKEYEKAIRQTEELRARYEAMLERVRAWEPPSSEHEEFKTFVEDQLVRSIDNDCSPLYREKPTLITGRAWKDRQMIRAADDVSYYTKELEKATDRNENRVRWVRQLYESLGLDVE